MNNMSKLNLLEHFLHSIGRPIGNALHQLIYHPADTVVDAASSCVEFVQDHPYTCVAVLGLGAYAVHRGWIDLNRKRLAVHIDIDTCVGGYRTDTTLWLGKRR